MVLINLLRHEYSKLSPEFDLFIRWNNLIPGIPPFNPPMSSRPSDFNLFYFTNHLGCKLYRIPGFKCNEPSMSGCFCKKEFYRDPRSELCVPKNSCPSMSVWDYVNNRPIESKYFDYKQIVEVSLHTKLKVVQAVVYSKSLRI